MNKGTSFGTAVIFLFTSLIVLGFLGAQFLNVSRSNREQARVISNREATIAAQDQQLAGAQATIEALKMQESLPPTPSAPSLKEAPRTSPFLVPPTFWPIATAVLGLIVLIGAYLFSRPRPASHSKLRWESTASQPSPTMRDANSNNAIYVRMTRSQLNRFIEWQRRHSAEE